MTEPLAALEPIELVESTAPARDATYHACDGADLVVTDIYDDEVEVGDDGND